MHEKWAGDWNQTIFMWTGCTGKVEIENKYQVFSDCTKMSSLNSLIPDSFDSMAVLTMDSTSTVKTFFVRN